MADIGGVVVDGVVNREKLEQLLAFGAEQEALDFKKTLDLSNGAKKARLDFVRDCLAMASLPNGGYLVIGVDESGRPALDQSPIHPAHFDSAALTQRLQGFVFEVPQITAKVHSLAIQGSHWDVALIHIAPPAGRLPLPVAKSGTYQDPQSSKEVPVLRIGQIFVRDGTSTVELNYSHWARLLERYREQIKAEAREDVNHLIEAFASSLASRNGSVRPPLLIDMDDRAFAAAVRVASRKQLSHALGELSTSGRGVLPSSDSFANALDKITIIGANAILNKRSRVLAKAIRALRTIYDAAPPPSAFEVRLTGVQAKASATVWREILTRVFVLGSAAVRCGDWDAVRALTLEAVNETQGYEYKSWLRHGLVYAYRANVVEGEGEPLAGLILSRARHYVLEHPSARPDVAFVENASLFSTTSSAEDIYLNSLCQFDFAWCVVASLGTSGNASEQFYPSYSAFELTRTYPLIRQLEADADVRTTLTANAPEKEVVEAIQKVIALGKAESSRRRSQ